MVCVWVWVGSHTNWTGVVGCASPIYADAKARRPQTYAEPYLTIFAFGSDYFGSTSGAFGQLGEQGRWSGTRFWQVWRLERVFSSVRAARGAGQVGWHSVLAGSVLGARVFISSGSSGSRAGGLALGFGRFGAWSASFSSVRAARGAGQVGWHSGLVGS